MASATTELEQEYAYNASQVVEQMQVSLDYLAGVLLPEECTEDYPDIHQMVYELITDGLQSLQKYQRYAIALPRGHAKTQLVKFLILYTILFTSIRYVMVVANSVSMSESIIDDCMDMLDSDNVVKLFGDFRTGIIEDNQKRKIFRYRGREIILKPMGIGSSLRGTNIRNRRPEFIICDDLQSLEEARSPEVGKRQLQWFLGTLLKARSYQHCMVLYVGNMYPDVEIGDKGSGVYTCILRNLQLSPEWRTIVTGGILADGTALWEAVIGKEELLSDLAMDASMGQADVWFAEVQNDPNAKSDRLLDLDAVPSYPYENAASELEEETGVSIRSTGELIVGKFIMIDPSLGKKTSDRQVVALCHCYDFKTPVVRKFFIHQGSAPSLVEFVLKLAIEHEVPLVCSEAYGYQESLLQWFGFIAENLNIDGVMFLPIKRSGMTGKLQKNRAIVAGFKHLIQTDLVLHPDAKSVYQSEAQIFDATVAEGQSDDVLDTAEYCYRVFHEYSTEWLMMPTLGSATTNPTSRANDEPELIQHHKFNQ